MDDASEPADRPSADDGGEATDGEGSASASELDTPPEDGEAEGADPPSDPETLREAVEAKYDFEQFTPADMAEMTVEEWEAAFDADTWITGARLLDRVEAELRSRVARRNLFAVVERTELDGVECVLAYDDVGYVVVEADGTVEGEGPIVEDVEPIVALSSMEEYDVPEPPADAGLPHPSEVGSGTGGLGDRLLLVVAGVQVMAGLGLLLAPVFLDLNPGGSSQGAGLLTTVAGLGFVFIGVVIGVLVANARLSGRFRAAEYRERLRATGVGTDERPSFLPDEPGGERGAGTAPATDPESGSGTADERAEPAPD